MQHRRFDTSRHYNQDSKPTAVSFQGGGWLAQFGFTGLLLAINAAGEPGVPIPTLFQNFSTLIGVSGGAWALVASIYSADYLDWMDQMNKAATDDIPTVFNQWITKLNQEIPPCSLKQAELYALKMIEKNVEFGFPKEKSGMNESLLQQTGFSNQALEQGCQVMSRDWDETIPSMFFGTAGIPQGATFAGTKHNEWAAGKTLIMGVSLPMRAVADTSYYPRSSDNFVQWNGKLRPSVKYHPVGDSHPEYMPAAINWKIGASGLKSPQPFCPGCRGGLSFKYTGGFFSSVKSMTSMWEQEYAEKAGNLEITLAAAATSSASGKADVARSRKASKIGCVGRANLYAAANPGMSVLKGGLNVTATLQNLKKWGLLALKKQLDLAAAKSVHALTDGGDTDLTGIVHAVQTGAKSIISLSLATSGETGAADPGTFAAFSQDGRMGSGRVFDTSYEEMQTAFNDTRNWLNFTSSGDDQPSGLVKLVVFEKTLTTVDAPWFGITKGHTAQVFFIWVSVNSKVINVGPPLTPLQQYGLLIRDLKSLLQSNIDFGIRLAAAFSAYGHGCYPYCPGWDKAD